MTREEIIEQLNLTIGLIKQDGKDWLDDRDIPILEECVKALSQEPTVEKDPCETCGYAEGSPFCLQYCPYDAERKKEQEPCDDAISRETILSKIKEVCFSKEWKWVQFRINNGSNGQRDFLIDYIEQLPSVTPSRRRGYWVHKGQGIYCSECGEESGYNPFGASRFSDYCPSCGVEMEIKE